MSESQMGSLFVNLSLVDHERSLSKTFTKDWIVM